MRCQCRDKQERSTIHRANSSLPAAEGEEGICVVRGEEGGGNSGCHRWGEEGGRERGGSLLLLCVTETVQLPIVTPPFL